jgi:hypothetical protein
MKGETMSPRIPIHFLIMAVVQEQDLENATSAAESLGAPVVYLASTGGFLGRRNATLLIGLPEGMEASLDRNPPKNLPPKGGIPYHASGGRPHAPAYSGPGNGWRRDHLCPACGTFREI